MSILKSKEPSFTDEITVDYLCRTYGDNMSLTENMALSEIYSIQVPMPGFNTLSTLTKGDFHKFLSRILNCKQQNKDSKVIAAVIAGAVDTFGCMVESKNFYAGYANDNRQTMHLIGRLLVAIRYLTIYSGVLDNDQLKVFINILERAAKRLENEKYYDKTIDEIINAFKTVLAKNDNKENRAREEVCSNTTDNYLKKETFEDQIKTPVTLKASNKLKPAPCIAAEALGIAVTPSAKLKSPEDICLSNSNSEREVIKRKANAFEVMMMSSKLLTKRQKLDVCFAK